MVYIQYDLPRCSGTILPPLIPAGGQYCTGTKLPGGNNVPVQYCPRGQYCTGIILPPPE